MAGLTEEQVSTQVGKVQVFRGGPAGPGAAGAVPLVYLHSAQGESNGLVLLERLADSFDTVAPVFPGFGESEGIDEIDDVEDAVFHLLDLFDQMGLGAAPVNIVGLSLGGWLAAEIATRYPERIGRLVLVNPAGLYIQGHEIKEIFGRDLDELALELFADQSHPVAVLMHQMASLATSTQGPDIPFEMLRPLLQSQAATAKLGWDPYLHNPKLQRRLYRVTAPTLIVHGAQDGLIPRAHAEAYAEGIADARLVDVEGAAHMLPLEKPDELAALVREFVAA
ncbi:MAG TPA: alpha/beta hydrolase [Acidimicrobiales bacterium]|jgi:pimeloyl-ACP methyl ester carboxylesterase|nr:alpha/beta hydrolase [Acidimicrobiales bacterium]